MKLTKALLALSALVLVGTQAQAQNDKLLINGAGATFPAPIYTKWFQDYNKTNPNVEINYQSIGSGGGIKQLTAKTVDFGASDAPMSDQEIQKAGGKIIHIPTVLGAVAVTYNLQGVTKPIKFDQQTLAEVFMGKITKWNDQKIAALNKDVKLPDQPMLVVYRSDSSGTTSVFTEYLAKVSPDWKGQVGAGKTVKWPTGLGGKGNEGVTGQIKNSPGSIGYVELAYAISEKLPVAELKNKAGTFVAPSMKSVTEAADGAVKAMPADMRTSITDAEGKNAYPIAAYTYLLVPQQIPGAKGTALVQFLGWAMDKGQKDAEKLSYAPLPQKVVTMAKDKIKTIETK